MMCAPQPTRISRVDAAEMTAMLRAPGWHRVLHVSFTDHALVLKLYDGCVLSVPLRYCPLLLDAAPAARRNWKLAHGGRGIRWPDIGAEFNVTEFLMQ
jgi:hypothetical protein